MSLSKTEIPPASGPLSLAVAGRSQHNGIENVLRAAFEPYVRKLGRELAVDAYAWLPSALQNGSVYIAVDGGRIVGVAATSNRGRELAIDQIAVLPERQGMGIGGWLLTSIEERARAEGVERMSLDTAMMMDDLLRLYRRHGFREVRRGPPEHGKDTHLRVYMVKDL